jgi:integrase
MLYLCEAGQDAVTRYALKLAPLVIVRPVELRQAEWTEFSLADGEWRIPAKKMKMRRPHRVPLASQALAIHSRAPENHWRIEISLSVGQILASPNQ